MMWKELHSEQVELVRNKFRAKGPCDNVSVIPQVKQFLTSLPSSFIIMVHQCSSLFQTVLERLVISKIVSDIMMIHRVTFQLKYIACRQSVLQKVYSKLRILSTYELK